MHLRPHRRHSRPMHLRLPPHPAHHPEAEAEADRHLRTNGVEHFITHKLFDCGIIIEKIGPLVLEFL